MEGSSSIDVIYIGKIVLALIFISLSMVGIYILLRFKRWHRDLVLMEQTAHIMRDDAMFNMTAYRANLAQVKQKIERAENKLETTEPLLNNKLVMDSAMSVLKMFLMKEKSILQWGTLGMKLAKSAFDHFKKG